MSSTFRQLADTYYSGERKIYFQGDENLNLTIGLLVGVFIAMAFELSTPEVCFLVALSVLMLAEVLNMNDVLSGFSNDGLITIGSLFLVVGAMEKSHLIDYGSRLTFGLNSSEKWGIFRFLSSSFAISAFFNNIPQVAIMVPIVKDWAKQRGISPSQLMMPLSYSVLAGGMLATVGTSTNLVIQGLLTNDKVEREPFNFFDPGAIGAPAGAVLIIYMMIAAPYLLPHHKEKEDPIYLRSQSNLVEVTVASNSPFVGVRAGDFAGRLGLEFSSILKISRPGEGHTPLVVDIEGHSFHDEDKENAISKAIESANFKPDEIAKNGHEYDYNIVTDSDTKPGQENHVFTSSKSVGNVLRIVNDSVYNPVMEFYRRIVSKVTSRYPSIFGLANYNGEINFFLPSDRSRLEAFENPEPSFIIQSGDVLTLANAENVINKLAKAMPWERAGLTIFGGLRVDDFPIFGDYLVEASISPQSNFVGLNYEVAANIIFRRFSSAVVSTRSGNEIVTDRTKLLAKPRSNETVLKAGDTLFVITSKDGLHRLSFSSDFSGVHKTDTVPELASYWSFYPTLVFLIIVSLVAANEVEITAAALAMASLFFIGGWIQPKEIETFVDVRLLMLMGCSLSFAKAMTTTGLADKIAVVIAGGNVSNTSALYLIYLATLLITELISNNAAAALMYPIAVAYADKVGVSYKPYAMVVMQAASMAFMCPIGYPTHVMVWLPGQYNFFDFCKFGLIPDIIWWVLSCVIAPIVWPF